MLLGELAGLANAVLWASTSIILGGLAGRLSVVRANAIQLVFGSLFYSCLVPLAGGRALFAGLTPARGLALAGTALLTMGVGDSLYFTGISRIGASRASPISVSSFPMLTLLLGALVLGERLTWPILASAVLIIAGIALLVSRSGLAEAKMPVSGVNRPASSADSVPQALPAGATPAMVATARARRAAWARPGNDLGGVLLVLAAALCWSAATLWLRAEAPGLPAVAVTSIRIPSGALFLLLVARARGILSLAGIGRRAWLLLAATGVIGTGLGSLTYIIAIQRTGAGLTALLTSTSPLWVLPLAAIFLHERLTRRVVLGACLALAGIWLVLL